MNEHRVDTTDGSAKPVELGDNFTGVHRPVVAKGPEHDYVVVSASSDNSGILKAYSNMEKVWDKEGPASEPILDSTGKSVFVVQRGQFHRYAVLNGQAECTSTATDLAATSNLVLDGDDDVCFWNNGTFYGLSERLRAPLQT